VPRPARHVPPAVTGYAVTLALALTFAVLASSLWGAGAPGATAVATDAAAALGGAVPAATQEAIR
jgi:hypothetical protein